MRVTLNNIHLWRKNMIISSKQNIITISGNIKSVAHHHAIAQEIDKTREEFNLIKIHLLDSISITSSVIGYLCKLVNLGHNIELYVADRDLHTLLDDLNLLQTLKVQQTTPLT